MLTAEERRSSQTVMSHLLLLRLQMLDGGGFSKWGFPEKRFDGASFDGRGFISRCYKTELMGSFLSENFMKGLYDKAFTYDEFH